MEVCSFEEIAPSEDSVIILQMTVPFGSMSQRRMEEVRESAEKVIGLGRKVMLVSADVNVYEIYGEDAVVLRLQGRL